MKTFKLITLGALAAMLFPASASAYQALANSTITNTASITWTGGSATSNTATITVDERIEVTESIDNSPITNVINSTNNALIFTVTNTGNGRETFKLSTSFTNMGPGTFSLAAAKVYVDTNKNGVYDAGTDPEQYSTGVLGNTSSIKAFIVSTYGASGSNGDTVQAYLEVTTATPGFASYAPGQVSLNNGDGGVDAVLGTTSGQVLTIFGVYQLASTTLAVFKSYSAFDPWSGNLAVPGATLRFHMRITGSGGGYSANATLTDTINPTLTSFTNGSIKVNGVAQSDAVDADKGSWASPTVTVTFGNFSSHWTRDVHFSTIIQ